MILRFYKAGALSLVVGISIVIALLLFALIFTFYYSQLSLDRDRINQELQRNINSAFAYVQANPQGFLNKYSQIDLFNNGKDSALISHEKWGIFDLVTIQAKRGKHRKSKNAFLGPSDINGYTLYLDGDGATLKVLGNTHLEGPCYTPTGKIYSESIGSRPFTGKQPREKQVLPSSSNGQKSDFLKSSLEIVYSTKKTPSKNDIPEIVNQSFQGPHLSFSSSDKVLLNQKLKGKIIITSNELIEISADSHLEDIILIAPRIVFKEFVSCAVQAFATDTIEVGTGVKLKYPSILVVYNSQEGFINVKSAKIEGGIIMINTSDGKKNLLKVYPGATITGSVFNNGFSDIQGKIIGSIYTKSLLLNYMGEIRTNSLIDATISPFKNERFLVPYSLKAPEKLDIVKWQF